MVLIMTLRNLMWPFLVSFGIWQSNFWLGCRRVAFYIRKKKKNLYLACREILEICVQSSAKKSFLLWMQCLTSKYISSVFLTRGILLWFKSLRYFLRVVLYVLTADFFVFTVLRATSWWDKMWLQDLLALEGPIQYSPCVKISLAGITRAES